MEVLRERRWGADEESLGKWALVMLAFISSGLWVHLDPDFLYNGKQKDGLFWNKVDRRSKNK